MSIAWCVFDACPAKEIRLKHGAPVLATFIVDRGLHPLLETSQATTGSSDAESPAAAGAHRLVVCTHQQIKVAVSHHRNRSPIYEISYDLL